MFSWFPCGSAVKNPPAMQDTQTWVQSLGQEDPLEDGMQLTLVLLQNPMDREAWRATVHRVTGNQTQMKQLSTHTYIFSYLLRYPC